MGKCADCLTCNCGGCCEQCSSCGRGCIRTVLFVLNFVFWLVGAALVAAGVWMLVDKRAHETIKSFADKLPAASQVVKTDNLQYISYGLIALGAVIFVIGFFGCCGAIKESKCLLVSYLICLIIIFIALLAILAFTAILRGAIESSKFVEEIEKQKNETGAAEIQFFIKCCGLTETPKVPLGPQCCVLRDASLVDKMPDDAKLESLAKNLALCRNKTAGYYHEQNCVEKLKTTLQPYVLAIIAVTAGLAFVVLVLVFMACCLCRSIGKQSSYD